MNSTISRCYRPTCKEYLQVPVEFEPHAAVKDSLTVRMTEKRRFADWAVVKDYLTTRSVLTLGDKE